MLGALLADAFFGLAVVIETAAALSLLRSLWGIPLRDELDPILAFYHNSASSAFGAIGYIIPARFPAWFTDAYALSFALCFFFFIAQGRAAMTPYNDAALYKIPLSRTEIVLDATLPVILCLLGAALLSFTLLPLLTPLAALWLLLLKLAGHPSWFRVSRSYHVNMLAAGALTAAIASFAR
jgi:hypothetical protein